MPVIASTIQAGSGSLLENRAMKKEPATNPTEVRPSWSPYSNSVAPSTWIGERQQQDVPQPEREEHEGADDEQRPDDRRAEQRRPCPDFRLATMTATLASSSGFGIG